MNKKNNNKGFTLAELLIVVAIIAVLVAIAIPVFTTQLEKSKEGTDIANLRSAYAAGQVAALTGGYGQTGKITNGEAVLYYNPNEDGSLTDTESKGVGIGQGTATDGKSDTSALTGVIKYTTGTTAVKGQKIKITIKNGAVKEVAFVNQSTAT